MIALPRSCLPPWRRVCSLPALEAWGSPLLRQAPPYLTISLPSLRLEGPGGHPPASPPPQMPAFLGSVLSLQALGRSEVWRVFLAPPAQLRVQLPGWRGTPYFLFPRVTVLCALGHRRVLSGRSGWAGAERMEQAWGWTRSASPGAFISAEQPAAALINIEPFNGEINYPPTARQNSRDKLSF